MTHAFPMIGSEILCANMADTEVFEVEQILDKRKTRGRLEYKVRWKNYDSDEDTWEPVENLRDAMDMVDVFNERMLRKDGLIQPIRIKIKSSKNKRYGGTLLTLKNPVSPKLLKFPGYPKSPVHHHPHSLSHSSEIMRNSKAKRDHQKGRPLHSDNDTKLAKLAKQLSYDDYMSRYKKKSASGNSKLRQRLTMTQWSQMSPNSKYKVLASPSSPSPMSTGSDGFVKTKKKYKHKSQKRKRLPESPDNSDNESEETVLYPLAKELRFLAGTSSSSSSTSPSRTRIESPCKKVRRSLSMGVMQTRPVIADEDGVISFPKKRNSSVSEVDGETTTGGEERPSRRSRGRPPKTPTKTSDRLTYNEIDGELGLTTPQSTPPSTPNGSQGHLEHSSHKVPSIMTPMMKLKKLSPSSCKVNKVMSNSETIKAKAFYSPPLKMLPERAAGSVARRRLSAMSMSSEDEEEPDRRFSMRVTENIFKYKEVVVKKSPEYTQVWLFTNSPSRNAVGVKALQELNSVLENAAKDETKAVVLCGSGSMFCSGLDLRLLAAQSYDERKKTAKALSDAVRTFVDTLIGFPKLLIAAVNGPAIGFGAAILPLCDIVYASDKAYFHLPYSSIGMTPEGCSSFTYPHYVGLALASEMLYGGRKLTALEACTAGLVSQVLWPTTFMQEVIPRVQCMVKGSIKGLMLTKSLVRSHLRAKLEYTNESECAVLKERWGSSECFKLVRNYVDKGFDLGV